MIERIKVQIKQVLEQYYYDTYNQEISVVVEEPKNPSLGDISVPMFTVVKALRKPMPAIISEAMPVIKNSSNAILEVTNVGAFVNLKIDKKALAKEVIKEAVTLGSNYGNSKIGQGKRITLDYSAPNIAKSFSVGHLRSTMIGNSINLILQKCGYDTFSINYLGDWGTQFGKMIVAYQKWGNETLIKEDPINQLTALYVKFHDEAEKNPALEDEAREAFRKMELSDPEYLELWRWIREESLKESSQIYDLLDVKFDSYNGEAFYNDKMEPIVEELEAKGLLVEDQGAKIVDLGDDVPPALIKRSDGGSLYITRDLAAVFYRKKEYKGEIFKFKRARFIGRFKGKTTFFTIEKHRQKENAAVDRKHAPVTQLKPRKALQYRQRDQQNKNRQIKYRHPLTRLDVCHFFIPF